MDFFHYVKVCIHIRIQLIKCPLSRHDLLRRLHHDASNGTGARTVRCIAQHSTASAGIQDQPLTRDQPNSRGKMRDFTVEF